MHKCVKHVWKDMLHWLYYLSMRLVTFPKKLCVLHKCCRNVIFFLKKIKFQKLTIWSMRDYPFLKLGYLTRKFRRQQGHAYWKHNALWNAETKAFREAKSCFAFSTLGTHFFSFFSFVIWAWLLTSLRLKWGEGNRGSTSDLQGKMTSEIMVQIVPLLRTKRGKEHQWFCHGSHVFGLWDISLKKSGYYKFFWGPDLISDECHLLVIFTAFSMKDFLLIFGQDKLDDICQLCYFYYQKRIYIWIRHMAIFSRDAVEF